MWRATPRRIWEVASTELRDHIADQKPGAPVAVTVSNMMRTTGRKEREDEEKVETSQNNATLPDLKSYYVRGSSEESGYRTGGKLLGPATQLPRSTSRNDNLSEAYETRRNRVTAEPWRSQSDSSLHPVDERIAGTRFCLLIEDFSERPCDMPWRRTNCCEEEA